MLLDITGKCHVCGEPGESVLTVHGERRLTGVPYCTRRCERRAVYGVGDTVVLDSGYTNGENGIAFKVSGVDEEGRFYGSVRGKRVEFIKEMAAKVGTKRAEAIMNQRQLQIWKESSRHGK